MLCAGGASARAAASVHGGKECDCSAQVPAAAGGSTAASDEYPAAGCTCGPVGHPRGCPGIHPGALGKQRRQHTILLHLPSSRPACDGVMGRQSYLQHLVTMSCLVGAFCTASSHALCSIGLFFCSLYGISGVKIRKQPLCTEGSEEEQSQKFDSTAALAMLIWSCAILRLCLQIHNAWACCAGVLVPSHLPAVC